MSEKKEIVGLKRMRTPGATRRDEWNRPNTKAAARLAVRVKTWEKEGKTSNEGFTKPGSLKVY